MKKEEFDVYFDNLNKIWTLAKPHCTDVDNEMEWLHLIKKNADETRMLRLENEKFLKERIFYYKNNIETMDEETEASLFEFATSLFHFAQQTDIGVSYHIHLLLLSYAEFHKDLDRIIRENYYLGLNLYYISLNPNAYNMGLNLEQIAKYFERASSYLPDLNTFSSKDTRGYILRSLANIKLSWPTISSKNEFIHVEPMDKQERRDYNKKVINIFSDEKMQKENPDLPWDDFLYALHFGRTVMLTYLRIDDDPDLAKEVLESAKYVYHKQELAAKEKDHLFPCKTVYIYNAAKYHAKLIPLSEFLDILLTQHEQADINDFSSDSIYRNLNLINYIREYAIRCSKDDHLLLDKRIRHAEDLSWRYIRKLPLNKYLNVVTTFVRDSMIISSNYTDISEYRIYLLNYILACHQPTYVHSLTVAYLTRELCDRLISTNPEYFFGLLDISNLSEVEISRPDILKFAYNCGLYHDIGKGGILDYVSIYGRGLFDEEFQILQTHPYIGYITLKGLSSTKLLADAALGHHKWYDDSRGYPPYFETKSSPIKMIIDIIAVADSIDAATDDVGRSYANAKTLKDLVAELNRDKGTRYSPTVVDLLLDDEYFDKIDKALKKERFHNYLVVYKDAQKNSESNEKRL